MTHFSPHASPPDDPDGAPAPLGWQARLHPIRYFLSFCVTVVFFLFAPHNAFIVSWVAPLPIEVAYYVAWIGITLLLFAWELPNADVAWWFTWHIWLGPTTFGFGWGRASIGWGAVHFVGLPRMDYSGRMLCFGRLFLISSKGAVGRRL